MNVVLTLKCKGIINVEIFYIVAVVLTLINIPEILTLRLPRSNNDELQLINVATIIQRTFGVEATLCACWVIYRFQN
jgi:hypothetical protein